MAVISKIYLISSSVEVWEGFKMFRKVQKKIFLKILMFYI